MSPSKNTTRLTVLREALRLFGEQGYSATTVAEIEQASGLAPGRGGLYRHFASKYELLVAAVEQETSRNEHLLHDLGGETPPSAVAGATGAGIDEIEAVARAGLARLREERDLNRLLLRDLNQFPDLLERTASADIRPVHAALSSWVTARSVPPHRDPEALAAVLAGAMTHYWLLEDIFGEHPSGVSEDRYIAELSRLCAEAMGGGESLAESIE